MGTTTRRFASLWLIAVALAPASLAAQAGQEQGDRPAMVNASTDPLLRVFRWRSIGPAGMGGRVDDIAVVESNPNIIYIGYATGGLWKTVNNGTTWEPIFDTYPVSSIGDIAIAPSNPDIIYVGTGEANNRQSSSFGNGVYKSTDGGRTFTHMGLSETQSIARIVVHPTNPDIVYVAAMGHLFGPNEERGLFKSTDGGKTWQKSLYVDAYTGATDVVMHPTNPNILFAATYQRQRTAYGFNGGGSGSGIWKTEDGGETWTRLQGNGLPSGTMGRIALDIARSNPDIIYAQIEVTDDRVAVKAAEAGGSPVREQQPGGWDASLDDGLTPGEDGAEELPLQQQPRPNPERSGVWRSDDGGRTWRFLSNNNVRPMYFSQIRVDPTNPEIVYTGGVQAYKSTDGGRTWETLRGFGHVDHHAIWINPRDGNHVILGNDGGIDISYDGGKTFESLRTKALGQFYQVSVDMRRPYYVCGGLQDNGSWCGPSSVRGSAILNQDWFNVGGGDGFYTQVDPTDHHIIYTESQFGNIRRIDLRTGEMKSIRPRAPTRSGAGGFGFGQGFQPPEPNIVPPPDTGMTFRWNWNTPVVLSPHNPRTVYTGANRFFKSTDRGDTWTMSADLTKQIDRDSLSIMGVRLSTGACPSPTQPDTAGGRRCILSKNDGVNSYGTIVTISESPMVPGIIWVGTDDGNIQLSRDGGVTWTEVGRNIPGGTREYYVSRVEASYADPATAYVALDGHRSDDLRPYVYVTRDYGRTWTSITSNLPETGNVNVIKQDPKNPNVLYVGTEFGFYVSLDEGREWKRLMNGLPVVRVDDVVVHPRDGDLVLGTHGRSIWIMDDITPLQQLTPEVLAADVYLFEPRPAVAWLDDRRLNRSITGHKNFLGEVAPPGTAIHYWLKNAARDSVRITITDVEGKVVRNLTGPAEAGINRVQWNLRGDPPQRPQGQQGGPGGFGGQPQGPPIGPGTYLVTLHVGGREYTTRVEVLEDRWMEER